MIKTLRSTILAFFLFCIPADNGFASNDSGNSVGPTWLGFFQNCADLNLPYFKTNVPNFVTMVKTGDAWEKQYTSEKSEIDRLNGDTCKTWSLSNNGDAALDSFRRHFLNVSSTAIKLKYQADHEVLEKLDRWEKIQRQEMSSYPMKFEEFPCGKAFIRTRSIVKEEVAALERKVNSIKELCPHAADKLLEQLSSPPRSPASTTTYGDGGKSTVETEKQPANNSTLTGVEDAQKKNAQTQKALQQK